MAYNGPLWPLVLVAAFLAWLTASAGPIAMVAFLLRFAVAFAAIVVVVKIVSWFLRATGMRRS